MTPAIITPKRQESNAFQNFMSIMAATSEPVHAPVTGRGIATNKHYPIPMHLQECYRDLGIAEGSLPIAETISRTELSLPMYYGMTDAQVQYVIDAINAFEG